MAVAPLLVEQMRAALDAHDLDAFVDFFHEDYPGGLVIPARGIAIATKCAATGQR